MNENDYSFLDIRGLFEANVERWATSGRCMDSEKLGVVIFQLIM